MRKSFGSYMKKHYNKIKFAVAILGVLGFLFSQTQLENQYKVAERNPASVLDIFSKNDPQLFADYFSHDHRIQIDFWTDKDEDSIKKRARLALHSAVSETLMSKDGFSKDLFKENLISALSNKFIKSLYLLKITNGTFQVDLNFSPKEVKTFEELMASNQFVDSSKTGTLLKALGKKEGSFEDQLLSRSGSGKHYENLGGTIILWFKILDLNWNPLDPIPNPPENAVKGFVKYRRYFKMKTDWSPAIELRSPSTRLDSKWEKSDKPRIITVDVTKSFNLKNPVPKTDRVEVYFGRIKHPKHYKTGPLAKYDLFSKDTNPNRLILNGSNEKQNYGFELKKLVFDVNENTFSHKSKIRSYGDWDGFNIGQKRKFKSQVRHSLLGDDSIHLIKALKLHRFHKSFKEVGAQ